MQPPLEIRTSYERLPACHVLLGKFLKSQVSALEYPHIMGLIMGIHKIAKGLENIG
ncbi:hypothetical protein [Terrilactibacillus tamarindi]|uniref:hypothetical protein n=1 Tax=Terrilactibacillus tamarindi TaxID=2599694 RepID=UPI0018AD2D54|nr:hypothetical protein [Terrilactibacillus tamarindi]